MGRGLLSLLLFACCLSAAVQESQAAPDDEKGAKTPPSEGDTRSQRDADASNATATVVDAPVNTWDGVSEATFIKRDDQPSDVDKEGGRGGRLSVNFASTYKLYSCVERPLSYAVILFILT